MSTKDKTLAEVVNDWGWWVCFWLFLVVVAMPGKARVNITLADGTKCDMVKQEKL